MKSCVCPEGRMRTVCSSQTRLNRFCLLVEGMKLRGYFPQKIGDLRCPEPQRSTITEQAAVGNPFLASGSFGQKQEAIVAHPEPIFAANQADLTTENRRERVPFA